MARMNLTQADRLFVGKGRLGKHQSGKPGAEGILPSYLKLAPALAVATDIAASQSITLGTPGVINGARASGGVATFDVPRNIVAAWTGAAVVTFTGTDQYGYTMTESSASGTTFTGKKAFKTITAISVSASVTLFTAGSGALIGLPYRVDANDIIARNFNGAVDAGTFVPADTTKPATSTTGDVRGTYAAAGTFDAVKFLSLLFKVAGYTGQPPGGFSAKEMMFGVDQA